MDQTLLRTRIAWLNEQITDRPLGQKPNTSEVLSGMRALAETVTLLQGQLNEAATIVQALTQRVAELETTNNLAKYLALSERAQPEPEQARLLTDLIPDYETNHT